MRLRNDISVTLLKCLKDALPLVEAEYRVAKQEKYPTCAKKYLAQLNEARAAIKEWENSALPNERQMDRLDAEAREKRAANELADEAEGTP